jgi:anti-sigma regulatory factor (Ser/Thr protein kinase)
LINKHPFRNAGENIIAFLISPWFMALAVALAIIFFTSSPEKYKAEPVSTGVANKMDGFETFCDTDNDDYSEKIILFNSQKGEAAVKIIDTANLQIQWLDFEGVICPVHPATGDADHDGRQEIYFSTWDQDSLFINIILCSGNGSFSTKRKFISQTNLQGNMDDYRVQPYQFCDLQMDGSDELLFHVFAGYSLQPRRMYAYDLKADSIFAGPLIGCQVNFVPCQLDDDPFPEFLGQSSSSDNIPGDSDIPYKDSSSWIMALDHKLEFIFPPVELPGHKSYIQTQKIEIDGKNYILALHELMNPVKSIQSLLLLNLSGEIIKRNDLPKPFIPENYCLLLSHHFGNNRIIIGTRKGESYTIGNDLKLTETGKSIKDIYSSHTRLDADQNGSDEILFQNADCESFTIVRNDLLHTVRVQVPFDRAHAPYFCLQKRGNEQPLLFVQQGDREMWFSYGINYLWYAKIPMWAGIYFFILGFIYMIRKFQSMQQKKAKDRENRLAELQLSRVSSYLDPHFTFNTLNTVSSLIYKEEKVKAYEILTRFASLIRAVLSQSGSTASTLESELRFVKDYMDIQVFRFGNAFDYEIQTIDGADLSLPVPKMMIQQYAENAVKHGLKNRGQGGKLDIIVAQQDGSTTVTIRDNGVGRAKAIENGEAGTGRGVSTLENVYELFEKTHGIKITHAFTDLFDEDGKAAGTEVNLRIRKII